MRIVDQRAAFAAMAALAAFVAAWLGPAAAADLEGFTLRDWNKMVCRPQHLRAGAILNIALPKKPSSYLSILTPGGRDFLVIYPLTQLDLIHSSDELAKMTSLSIDTSTAKGIETKTMEPIFVRPGVYTILVGTQFETERPIVNGWCRVTFRPGN